MRVLRVVVASLSWLVVLVTPAPAADPPVSVLVERTQGRTLRYGVALGVRLEQSAGASAPLTTEIASEADLALTFGATDAEGVTTVTAVIDRLRAVRREGDSLHEAALPQVTAEVPATPDAADFLKIQRAIKGCTLTLKVDAAGEVTAVEGLAAAIEAADQQRTFDRTALGMFDPEYLRQTLGPIFSVDGAGKSPRRVGDGWQSVEIIPLGQAGSVSVTTDWTVASADAEKVVVEGAPAMSVLLPKDADDLTPKLEIAEQRARVSASWGVKEKALRSRVAEQSARTAWSVGAERVEQKQTTRASITLRPGT